MALFTRLDAPQLAEIADRFVLGDVDRADGIAAGTVNSNYRLATTAGEWFVRVNEGKREDDVAYEAELVSWLAARGVPTPRPVNAADGRPYALTSAGFITVFPWVAGAHRKARALAEADADAEAAGRALAAIHVAGAGFPRRRASRYAFDAIVVRAREVRPPAGDGELMATLASVDGEIAWLAAHRAPLPAGVTGVIHGDLFPDNVLFAEVLPGAFRPLAGLPPDRIAALLDFEQASDGAFAYDLAVCLAAWCYGDDFDPARSRALVRGYQAVRPLAPSERDALWIEARAAAMRFTVTRITDVHLSATTTPLVRATKDYRRYHARLLRLRAMGAAGFAALIGY